MSNREYIVASDTANRRPRTRRLVKIVGASALAIGAGALSAGVIPLPLNASQTASAETVATQSKFATVSFADVVEKVSPAVVNIQVTQKATPQLSSMNGVPNNMREFFEHHFGNKGMPGGQGAPEQRDRVGAGSGFVIDAEGYIVTNEHVIKDAHTITVTFKDGTVADAKLIGHDEKTDLALIKIDMDKPVPYVEFGDSELVREGDWVVTVGNPFGLGHSVNVGIVSARGRTIGAGPYDDFLQIDAQINRG